MRAQEVQFALLRKLWSAGIEADGEAQLPARSPLSRAKTFKADVLVYGVGRRPIAAIECKGYSGPPNGQRQRENYEMCGVPPVWCGPNDINNVVRRMIQYAAP